MTVTIQSMESFKTCPYMITTGFLVISTVIAKTLGCVLLILISILLFSVRGKKKAWVLSFVSILLLVELFFAIADFSDVLREINLVSLFSFERFFIRYLNIEIFDVMISRLPVFVVFVCIVFISLAVISTRSASKRMEEVTRETEQAKYYIAEVSEQLDLVTMPVKTGRDVLDALLLKKQNRQPKKG